jgi:hypothetical protein
MDIEEHCEVRETRTVEYKLINDHIIGLLKAAGVTIPDNAEVQVFFRVPGGGDWSNTDIDLDEDYPLTVRVKTQTLEVT